MMSNFGDLQSPALETDAIARGVGDPAESDYTGGRRPARPALLGFPPASEHHSRRAGRLPEPAAAEPHGTRPKEIEIELHDRPEPFDVGALVYLFAERA